MKKLLWILMGIAVYAVGFSVVIFSVSSMRDLDLIIKFGLGTPIMAGGLSVISICIYKLAKMNKQ